MALFVLKWNLISLQFGKPWFRWWLELEDVCFYKLPLIVIFFSTSTLSLMAYLSLRDLVTLFSPNYFILFTLSFLKLPLIIILLLSSLFNAPGYYTKLILNTVVREVRFAYEAVMKFIPINLFTLFDMKIW